ncbi:hypothetical protein B9Z55_027935 [Caenorhabditis nigoni]|uniref:Piwi domain-containing protein n=1 Tax=Caenorhabditis nigoni TaxID=1611254 RepID=A0A2G5SDP0_9PELO|nr:hypothetical protein B9Z55_027935 [Caenorhabditis nigoni]
MSHDGRWRCLRNGNTTEYYPFEINANATCPKENAPTQTIREHYLIFVLRNNPSGSNIRPGTMVEDTVTTKDFYDVFLTTQVGQVGLARPTHYYVLFNDWKVESSGDVLAYHNTRPDVFVLSDHKHCQT